MGEEKGIDLESLSERIAAKLRGGGKRRDPDDDLDDDLDEGGRGHISRATFKARVSREVEKRRAAETQLEEVSALVEQLRAGHAKALVELKTLAAEQVGAIATRHSEDLSLLEHGVKDDLGRQTLRAAYDRLPKADRPKSVVDYWGGLTAAHAAHIADPKANPTAPEVPAPLTPYLPAPSKADTQQPRKGAPPAGPGGPQKGIDVSALPIDQGMEAFMSALATQERQVRG